MEAPPASAGGEVQTLVAANEGAVTAAAAAATAEEKVQRTRKRSRYLSPPYTDPVTGADAADDGGGPRRRQEQAKNDDAEGYSLLLQQLPQADVVTADVLSALHGAALFGDTSLSPSPGNASARVAGGGGGGDADVLLRLFALHRRSKSMLSPDASASTGSTTKLNKDGNGASGSPSPVVLGHNPSSAGRAMADAGTDPSAGNNATKASKKEEGNPHRIGAATPTASATAAAIDAGNKKKKVAMSTSSDKPNATGGSRPQSTGGVANSVAVPPRKKRNKKKAGQGQDFSNPVALLLDFTQDTVLPSKDEFVSAFRRFGFVIEPETDIATDTRRARIVFGTSSEAEAAFTFSIAGTLGVFGPPFAVVQLLPLAPIKLDLPQQPSPARKLPLTDIRKNLEKMILSLTRPSPFCKDNGGGAKPTTHNLVGEMQGLLAKVEGMLSAKPPSSATALHHH